MAKHKKKKQLTRKQKARHDKEQQIQRIITWSAIGVGILIVVILGYGLITELVIKAQAPVAKVDNAKITTQDYQNRLRYERYMTRIQLEQYQSYINQIDPNDEAMQGFLQQMQYTAANLEQQLSPEMASLMGKQVLDRMVEETLIREEAAARNLTVSTAQVDQEVELMMGYDREAAAAMTTTATLTDTAAPMTAEEFNEVYEGFKSNVLETNQFSEQEYRDMIEADLLRNQLQEMMVQDAETVADQVQVTVFVTGTEEAAQVLQNRINEGGETPEALIEELSYDASDQSSGYTLPWLPVGYLNSQLSQEMEQIAFNTPVGRAADPVLGPGDRHFVIYVNGHEERELSEDLQTSLKQQAYNTWLEEQKAAHVEYLDWEAALLTEP